MRTGFVHIGVIYGENPARRTSPLIYSTTAIFIQSNPHNLPQHLDTSEHRLRLAAYQRFTEQHMKAAPQ